jgi:hypothetical protein
MNKEFLSYEMALELKKLGFDEPCIGNYRKVQVTDAKTGNCSESIIYLDVMHFTINFNENNKDTDASALTFYQTFRFFREQFNWQASIEATKDQHSRELGYNYWIWNSETGLEYHTMPMNKPSGDWEFKTYEEAEIACLLKLIEIIKTNQYEQTNKN